MDHKKDITKELKEAAESYAWKLISRSSEYLYCVHFMLDFIDYDDEATEQKIKDQIIKPDDRLIHFGWGWWFIPLEVEEFHLNFLSEQTTVTEKFLKNREFEGVPLPSLSFEPLAEEYNSELEDEYEHEAYKNLSDGLKNKKYEICNLSYFQSDVLFETYLLDPQNIDSPIDEVALSQFPDFFRKEIIKLIEEEREFRKD